MSFVHILYLSCGGIDCREMNVIRSIKVSVSSQGLFHIKCILVPFWTKMVYVVLMLTCLP
jgi:hypothetical protein